jgi:hypothetical protein
MQVKAIRATADYRSQDKIIVFTRALTRIMDGSVASDDPLA